MFVKELIMFVKLGFCEKFRKFISNSWDGLGLKKGRLIWTRRILYVKD